MGQNALIGNVTGDDLLRYALTMPFSVANVGMDGFAPLESCVEVAKEPLLSAAEAEKIRTKLNFDPSVTKLPYLLVKTTINMLQILSETEKALIHKNGKQILEEVGIRVRNKMIYDLLLDAGGIPDKSDNVRIYLPGKTVEKYLALCPKQFTIKDRSGNQTEL